MKHTIKNYIYIILFTLVEVIMIIQITKKETFDLLTLFGYLALGAIGYVGFLEILFLFRLTIVLPEFYIDSYKNICVNSQINRVASSSIKNFNESLISVADEYKQLQSMAMKNFASSLKFTAEEFDLLQSIKEEELHSFVQIKSSEPTAKDMIERRLSGMLKNPLIIMDSKKLKNTMLREVDYYINFLDVMYDSKFSEDVVLTMCNFIRLKLEPARLSRVSYIIVPYDSNILLGAGVARILNKKAIKVLKEIPDYHLEKHREGYINEFNENNSIIIHDALYTGRQVLESCKILHRDLHRTEKENFPNFLFFSLCARRSNDPEKDGVEILKGAGFEVYSILEIDDQYVRKLWGKK